MSIGNFAANRKPLAVFQSLQAFYLIGMGNNFFAEQRKLAKKLLATQQNQANTGLRALVYLSLYDIKVRFKHTCVTWRPAFHDMVHACCGVPPRLHAAGSAAAPAARCVGEVRAHSCHSLHAFVLFRITLYKYVSSYVILYAMARPTTVFVRKAQKNRAGSDDSTQKGPCSRRVPEEKPGDYTRFDGKMLLVL